MLKREEHFRKREQQVQSLRVVKGHDLFWECYKVWQVWNLGVGGRVWGNGSR